MHFIILSEVSLSRDRIIHDLITDYLIERLRRDYKEIRKNPDGDPDLILANHGIVMAYLEVETEESITPEKAKKWKELSGQHKLILMIPKASRVKVTDLLWQQGITGGVSVGTYEITINMP